MKEKIKIGIMPVKRLFFSIDTAREEYDIIMPIIRAQLPTKVEFVDVDDLCEKGMATNPVVDVPKVVKKFKEANVDALFFPFCDFGEESTVLGVAKSFKLPVLIWGSRDKLSTYEKREKETQCGVFAATKVLRNYGVTFSYIWNCEANSPDFVKGFEKFVRVAAALKALRGLNVASIGNRPAGFYSVIHSQLHMIRNFDITVKPIAMAAITDRFNKIKEENAKEVADYVADLKTRIDCSQMDNDDYLAGVAAGTLAIEQLMKEADCRCAGFDCFGVSRAIGLSGSACAIEGELADRGLPTACEMDIWGAISSAMLQAATLGEESAFCADWTYRHPTNDNAELIWHGGPFPCSLARKDTKPVYKRREFRGRVMYEANWELKSGPITMLRMDELDGDYYVFAGVGKSCEGPATTGTYVWLEVDNWKRWEEKLILGPYIHHVAGTYGDYFEVFREVVKYLNKPKMGTNVTFDHPGREGDYSL